MWPLYIDIMALSNINTHEILRLVVNMITL